MADFYLDEDVGGALAGLLEARGHTVLTTQQANRLKAKDAEQLLLATDLRRLLITHNEDDYESLCRLWRRLAQRWGRGDDNLACVIVIPQKLVIPYYRTAAEIHNLVRDSAVVWGEFFNYDPRWGWIAGLED